jgi:hypothetical protein
MAMRVADAMSEHFSANNHSPTSSKITVRKAGGTRSELAGDYRPGGGVRAP